MVGHLPFDPGTRALAGSYASAASHSMHTADGRSQRLLPLQVVLSAALQRMYGSATYGHGPTLQDTPRGRPGTDAGLHELGPVLGAEEARRGPG